MANDNHGYSRSGADGRGERRFSPGGYGSGGGRARQGSGGNVGKHPGAGKRDPLSDPNSPESIITRALTPLEGDFPDGWIPLDAVASALAAQGLDYRNFTKTLPTFLSWFREVVELREDGGSPAARLVSFAPSAPQEAAEDSPRDGGDISPQSGEAAEPENTGSPSPGEPPAREEPSPVAADENTKEVEAEPPAREESSPAPFAPPMTYVTEAPAGAGEPERSEPPAQSGAQDKPTVPTGKSAADDSPARSPRPVYIAPDFTEEAELATSPVPEEIPLAREAVPEDLPGAEIFGEDLPGDSPLAEVAEFPESEIAPEPIEDAPEEPEEESAAQGFPQDDLSEELPEEPASAATDGEGFGYPDEDVRSFARAGFSPSERQTPAPSRGEMPSESASARRHSPLRGMREPVCGMDLYDFAYLPRASLEALPEICSWNGAPTGYMPYLRRVFRRLTDEGKILLTEERGERDAAALHTGLIDKSGGPIYAFFVRNRAREGTPYWFLQSFLATDSPRFGELSALFPSLPEPPTPAQEGEGERVPSAPQIQPAPAPFVEDYTDPPEWLLPADESSPAARRAHAFREREASAGSEFLGWAYIPLYKSERLIRKALPEPWFFGQRPSGPHYPILTSTLNGTFHRLVREDKLFIGESEDGEETAVFHTGLFDRDYEPIYAVLCPNPMQNAPSYWLLRDFCTEGEMGFTLAQMPPRADFLEGHFERLLYTPLDAPLLLSYYTLLVKQISRLPDSFLTEVCGEAALNIDGMTLSDARALPARSTAAAAYFAALARRLSGSATIREAARDKLDAALGRLLARLDAQPLTAVPGYSPARDECVLLLPLTFSSQAERENRADIVLSAARSPGEDGDAFVVRGILPLDLAYECARLIARPTAPWLDPGKITETK